MGHSRAWLILKDLMTDDRAAANAVSPSNETRDWRRKSLCAPFVELLPVTGVSISVFDEEGRQSTICASDPTAARIDELQFELGEGPHWAALSQARPVMVSDVRADSRDEWPVFGGAILELEVGALFAFPMVMGAVTVGVIDLYRTDAGSLDVADVATARALAAGTARRAVNQAIHSAGDDTFDDTTAPATRREVHQATGIILVQLDVTATEAFFRLRAFSFANGRTVHDVAHDVVSGDIDFRLLAD